jgi:U3 small nucleolar RNA-associated protein 16
MGNRLTFSRREEQAKREKRRKLDERRKVQAKSSKTKEISPIDDLLSESTATLQGSITQDARRAALPALLPDDILNAEPAERPLTPPAEDSFAVPKKSSKLRFLEKSERAPKDMQVGDVTIRVLDAPSSSKSGSKPVLAPKASKAGRNVKNNWMKRDQSSGKVNGLRRTAGGPSGFVRR